MATVVHTTTFSHLKSAGTTDTITIPAATAGNTLVVVTHGGAQASYAGLTKRTTYGGGDQDVSISDKVAAGGETSLAMTLNGAENVSGIVYELGGAGAFIAATSSGNLSPGSGTDWQVAAPSVSVTGNAVLVAGFTADATSATVPYNGTNQWRQLGPLGKLYGNAANQPGSGAGTEFVWASGLADITAAGSYPGQLAAGTYAATSQWLASTANCIAAQAAYADASGVATNAYANPIVAENSLPGTLSTNWYLGVNGTNATIAGYCDRASYAPGDTVSFKVDSTGHAFRVELYRLGYYGWETMGARNVNGNQGGHIVGTVVTQSAPSVDGTYGSTSCAWTTNATWTVPANATPGVYYVLFRRTDDTSQVSSGHFIVRGASAPTSSQAAVVLPDLTYQAYNVWGATADHGALTGLAWSGRSLYQIGGDGGTGNAAHRAYAVSFDRPYSTQSTQANTYLFDADHPWIVFAEAQGYNLTYMSTLDLDANTTLLNAAKLVVLLGHHEYWTTNVYDCITHARDAGVNLAVFSSNTALWHVRFDPADTGRRTVICYKDSLTADSTAGWSGTGYDPVSYTGTWRDTRQGTPVLNPDIRPENALTGQMFVESAPTALNMSVPFASKGKPIWRNSASIQALTSGGSFTTTTHVVGDEVDYPDGSATQPANLVNLSPTVQSFTNGANATGSRYVSSIGPVTIGFTLYRAPSGALVFNTGSWRGWQGIARWAQSGQPGDVVTAVDPNWQNALLAVLYDLGVAPVAARELRPGIDAALTNPATGAPGTSRAVVARAYGLTVPSVGFLAFF